MSNVDLQIGGRSYTVATSVGDEDRIRKLGAVIDDKVRELGAMAGQSEQRQLLFAALLLADDLEQARARPPSAGQETIAAPFEDLAEALESLALKLETTATALEDRD